MATKIDHQNTEHDSLMRVLNFRLPHSFKKIGLIAAVLIFASLLASKFLGGYSILTKDILRTLVLFFLLIAMLSKDKLEDEYNRLLRYQSFKIAFVITTIYAITLPLISVILDLLITNITGDGQVNFYKISSFEVIFMIICMQLLIFKVLKKINCAE